MNLQCAVVGCFNKPLALVSLIDVKNMVDVIDAAILIVQILLKA